VTSNSPEGIEPGATPENTRRLSALQPDSAYTPPSGSELNGAGGAHGDGDYYTAASRAVPMPTPEEIAATISLDAITEPSEEYATEALATGAAPAQEKKRRGKRSVVREVVETVVLAAIIFLGVRAIVQNFKVEGSSMYPSFIDGEYMLVNKAVYSRIDLGLIHKVLPFVDPGKHPKRYIFHGPQRGDVIVFVPPIYTGASESKDFIKRVIGVPGDTVDFRDSHVYVNGKLVVEPYISAPTECAGQYCHMTLQPDQYFVMGDNRTNSSDSRMWGAVSADKIIGKALFSYWCGGPECKGKFDHAGLSPNHSPVLTPQNTTP
jgi:signal peptidase I